MTIRGRTLSRSVLGARCVRALTLARDADDNNDQGSDQRTSDVSAPASDVAPVQRETCPGPGSRSARPGHVAAEEGLVGSRPPGRAVRVKGKGGHPLRGACPGSAQRWCVAPAHLPTRRSAVPRWRAAGRSATLAAWRSLRVAVVDGGWGRLRSCSAGNVQRYLLSLRGRCSL